MYVYILVSNYVVISRTMREITRRARISFIAWRLMLLTMLFYVSRPFQTNWCLLFYCNGKRFFWNLVINLHCIKHFDLETTCTWCALILIYRSHLNSEEETFFAHLINKLKKLDDHCEIIFRYFSSNLK